MLLHLIVYCLFLLSFCFLLLLSSVTPLHDMPLRQCDGWSAVTDDEVENRTGSAQDASVTSGSNVADQTANLASWRMIVCTAKHHSTWWTSVCQSRVSHQVSIFDLLLDDFWLFRDASSAHSAHVSAHVPSRSMARRSGMHCQTVCEIRLLA